jgi:tetratricopeptide (TPR) repeat protein/tRNA A-37 threonylcarbamoyl transferase component Bud32
MREDQLDDLLSVWQEERLQGREVEAGALCSDCPELAAELAQRIDLLRHMDNLVEPADASVRAGELNGSSAATGHWQTGVATGGAAPTLGSGCTHAADTGPVANSVPGYEILAELGRGGMGVVYKARQRNLNRVVALKMILAGSHAGIEATARFLQEAETVARLKHPNIVSVYDFGSHDGKPYFSLEYLEGGSLADRLGGEPQPPAAAAQTLETLARAVHAAHELGIVHRDLKPANVLLAADGTPKIVDFGLAKQGDVGLTATGDILGTPSYMAPEQATGATKAVGPAADIYALGAILYELLTGRPPFKGATVWDTVQMVVDAAPVAPSQFQPKVPRDLETICLKCLQKEPHRRYPSALALADDLHRFLGGEPISARPVGKVERIARFCRRKPLVASLCFGLATVLAVGIPWLIALTIVAEYRRVDAEEKRISAEQAQAQAIAEQQLAKQAQQQAEAASIRAKTQEDLAKQEAEKAKEFSDLLLSVFESADPAGLQGYTFSSAAVGSSQLSARDVLDRAADKLEKLDGNPHVRATQLAGVGNVYRSLGLYKRAESLLERAYTLRKAALGEDHEETADSQFLLGWVYHEQGVYPKADAYYKDALRVQQRLNADSPKVTATLFNLAWLTAMMGDYPKAEQLFLDVIARRQKQHGTELHRDVAIAKGGLALHYLESGQPAKAAPFGAAATAIFRKISSNERLGEAFGHFQTGLVMAGLQQHRVAATSLRKALELVTQELGESHPYAGIIAFHVGQVLESQGKNTEAEGIYRQGLKIARATTGLGHPKVPVLATALGGILRKRGATAEAIALFEEVREAHVDRFGADHPLVADVLIPYAALLDTQSFADARDLLGQAVAIYASGQQKYGMKGPRLKDALRNLSSACRQRKAVAQGLAAGLSRKQAFPDDQSWLFETASQLARLVPVADNDTTLDASQRKQLVAECAAASLDTLDEAIAKGFRDPLRFEIEPALAPVRAFPQFARLANKLPALDRSKVQIEPGRLTAQDPFDGKLTQSRQRVFKVQMQAGSKYQLDLLSVEFDPFLRVEDEARQEKAYDDDSGGDLNARLVFAPAVTGEYRIIVTSYVANETGAFVLAIQPK